MSRDPFVSIRDATKVYRHLDLETEVLHKVSLDVAEGEFVALQGPSGSGKSTLLHILGLLERASSGAYLLAGRDVSSLDDDAASDIRNQLIGFVFQSFHLIPYATALDNVLLPGLYDPGARGGELRRRARELLDRVGLSERETFRPTKLSGGQQQRVALARALINEPRLILADEPTGQLDSATSREIMELLRDVHQAGKTIVVVTHDEETAAFASRRILLEDGRVVPDGPAAGRA